METKNLIYKMLTTSTGKAICDSADSYGRNWEKNQNKTIEDFQNSPECTLEVYRYKNEEYEFIPTISLFHRLNSCLELDELCQEFNSLPVDDWRGGYYGVSDEGMEWLGNEGFIPDGDGWNTYNFDCINSQITQGQDLTRDGYRYILLQIHQGCDARGGYTDAKLFKLKKYAENWALFDDTCFFSLEGISIDFRGGDFTNEEGDLLDKTELNELGKKCTQDFYHGDINKDW